MIICVRLQCVLVCPTLWSFYPVKRQSWLQQICVQYVLHEWEAMELGLHTLFEDCTNDIITITLAVQQINDKTSNSFTEKKLNGNVMSKINQKEFVNKGLKASKLFGNIEGNYEEDINKVDGKEYLNKNNEYKKHLTKILSFIITNLITETFVSIMKHNNKSYTNNKYYVFEMKVTCNDQITTTNEIELNPENIYVFYQQTSNIMLHRSTKYESVQWLLIDYGLTNRLVHIFILT